MGRNPLDNLILLTHIGHGRELMASTLALSASKPVDDTM